MSTYNTIIMNCLGIAQCILNIKKHKECLDKEANSENMTSDKYICDYSSKLRLYGTVIYIMDKSMHIQQPNGRIWFSELSFNNTFMLNDTVTFRSNHKKIYNTTDTYTIFYAKDIKLSNNII